MISHENIAKQIKIKYKQNNCKWLENQHAYGIKYQELRKEFSFNISTWTASESSVVLKAKASAEFGAASYPEIGFCSSEGVGPGGPSIASGPNKSPRRSADGTGCVSILSTVPLTLAIPWSGELPSCT